jgi:hypothetical protein
MKQSVITAVLGSILVLSLIGIGIPTSQTTYATTTQVVTITGITGDENIRINENNANAEVCTFPGATVRGSAVTSLGPTAECSDSGFANHGWDISPDANGVDTVYRVNGNGGTQDRATISDGTTEDDDIYQVETQQYLIDDGAGDDIYSLKGTVESVQDSLSFSDSTGRDRLTFTG